MKTPDRLEPKTPFPPYRYIPGQAAHPSSHRDGYRFGEIEVLPAIPSDGRWSRVHEHRCAIDLFNHRYFWEAHEVWEGFWHQLPRDGPEFLAVKALIQAAAALLKFEMKHASAAERLSSNVLMLLEAASSHGRIRGGPCLALDLIDFAERFDAHVHRGKDFPFLEPILDV